MSRDTSSTAEGTVSAIARLILSSLRHREDFSWVGSLKRIWSEGGGARVAPFEWRDVSQGLTVSPGAGSEPGYQRSLAACIAEIAALRNAANLDSDEARQVRERASRDGMVFVAGLPDGMPMPTVSGASDGEVVLEWRGMISGAVAGFEGDGCFGYALLRGQRYQPGEHDGSVAGTIPADLLEYLRKV